MPGFFGFGRSTSEPELSPALSKRLDDLEAENRRIKRKQDELEVEWNEWYDKFRLLFARLSKRIKDAAPVETPPQDAPRRTNGHEVAPYHGPIPSRRNY
jgi:hypothetical protein